MRGIGIQAEVSVQEVGIGVVVELASAEPALQAERSETRPEGAQVQRGHVARHLGNPVAHSAVSCLFLGHRGVGVLVAAIDGQPACAAQARKSSGTPRLSIWPRFSRISRIGEDVGLMVTAVMGRLTWVRK